MEDEKLVQQALDGDDEAWRTLHDRYVGPLFQYAYLQIGDYHQAEEITQDIMFKMARHLASFKGKSQFKTWLFAIGRRVVIDHLRQLKKQRRHVLVEDDDIDRLSPRFPSAEDEALSHHLQEEILRCLQQMSINDRTVIYLRFIEGFSLDETAKAMSKTKLAVKSLQTRAKQKLANLMRKEVNLDEK